jgi:hypothetical protein
MSIFIKVDICPVSFWSDEVRVEEISGLSARTQVKVVEKLRNYAI